MAASTTPKTDAPKTAQESPTAIGAAGLVATAKQEKFTAAALTMIKTAPAWRPKDGDTLEGTIITILKRVGEYGPYPLVIVDTGAPRYTAVHAFHGVLGNELKEMRAKSGDNITILYTGKRTANRLNADGSEKQYHGYSVVPTDGGDLEVFDFS